MRSGVEIGLMVTLLLGVSEIPLPATQREGPPRRMADPENFDLPGGSRVEFRSFHAPSLGKEVAYSVFLPPSYAKEPEREFPVIYFLHGMFNDHTSWTVERYGNLPGRVEEILLGGEVAEFIMVHPSGENSFYTNSVDGTRRYEDYVRLDLVQEIEKSFRARGEPSQRAIGGTSMGGYGALKIAMKFPELFASVEGDSPIVLLGEDPSQTAAAGSQRAQFFKELLLPIFGFPFERSHWEENSLEVLARRGDFSGLNICFAYGTADRYNNMFPMEEGVRTLAQILDERRVPYTFKLLEGGPHGWELVQLNLEELIAFLAQTF